VNVADQRCQHDLHTPPTSIVTMGMHPINLTPHMRGDRVGMNFPSKRNAHDG
jgi:hypothetical protein